MKSDFLCSENHEVEHLNFHSLRHMCGAWLTMTGAYPKAVQSVMRHSTITMTMDACCHLFPGQEADTVARFSHVMDRDDDVITATGTFGEDQDLGSYSITSNGSAKRNDVMRQDATGMMRLTKDSPILNLCLMRQCAKPCKIMRVMGAGGFEPP